MLSERFGGGAYITTTGRLNKIDGVAHVLALMDGTRIPLENVTGLESGCIQEALRTE